jgi:hypothetical protein
MLVFGSTNKTFEWFQSTASWTSSEHINLQIGKTFKINGTTVLNATTLGSTVTSSSLTSVGTISSGTWNGTPIAAAYGGTGLGTFVNNGAIYANSTSTLTSGTLPVAAGGTGAITLTGILKGNGTGAITAAVAGTDFMSAPSGTGLLKANNGSYSLATAVAGTDYLSPSAQATYTATQTFNGNASVLAAIFTNIAEPATITSSAAGGTINFDLTSQSILIFTGTSTGNWTINFRGNSVTQTNSLMTAGQVMTATFIATNGSSPYYPTACQIDGNAVSVKWQGAVTPVSGNANSYDIYTYTIVKTSSGFIVFGTQTRFA